MSYISRGKLIVATILVLALFGCGGGGGSAGSTGANSNVSAANGAGGAGGAGAGGAGAGGAGAGGAGAGGAGAGGSVSQFALAQFGLTACVASGSGTDYRVGAGQTYSSLESVPWENLQAGDTVRIFYSATPYASKFMIMGQGTASAPIRICGVPGPSGQRPIIDGTGARSRTQLAPYISGDTYYRAVHESRSIIQIKNDNSSYYAYPKYIQIDGLNIRNAYPGSSYTNTAGQVVQYGYAATDPLSPFTSCIWIDRGQNITIANNEISGCPMAIYTKSTDDGYATNATFSITKDIRIIGNYMWGAGYPGEVHEHTTYTESQGIVIEYNHFGPLHAGADGNSIKDRSIGTVLRYNLIEGGAHSIDLVEAEDFPLTATADPAYRSTYVYGNIIKKIGDDGSVIHYGGDHFDSAPGNTWGEPIFRQGTLYFFNNTVYTTGTVSWLFQISTTLEHVEAWNNIFTAATTNLNTYLRMPQYQIDPPTGPWIPGGTLTLGKNFISSGWTDTDIYHTMSGALNGSAALVAGTSLPIDTATYVPLANSVVLNAAVTGPAGASAYTVTGEISSAAIPAARPVNGPAMDLGAVER